MHLQHSSILIFDPECNAPSGLILGWEEGPGLGKWVQESPKLLSLDEPTGRGGGQGSVLTRRWSRTLPPSPAFPATQIRLQRNGMGCILLHSKLMEQTFAGSNILGVCFVKKNRFLFCGEKCSWSHNLFFSFHSVHIYFNSFVAAAILCS